MIIGVTGNSGTGKTSLCIALSSVIENKSVCILDADKIAKEISVPGNKYFDEIINLFGDSVLSKEGMLNREKLASIIFGDDEKRESLDKITYKYVVEETKKRLNNSNCDIVLIDAPLLIESGLSKICDVVISVIANKEVKLERICKRDNLKEETAILRLNSQKDNDFYIMNSNYVVVNNNTDLIKQAKDVIDYIKLGSFNNDIVIRQDKELKILQFKRLLEYKDLIHAFSLKSLDFGSNNSFKEKENEVRNSYKTLCSFLKIDEDSIVRAFQTHTNNVAIIKDEKGIFPEELINIDGLITNKKEKALSLVYADCTPIFIFDPNKSIIGIVHSGWQGTLKRIIENAISKMINEFNCNREDLLCAIGPTIRKCHFEVDEDVKNDFVNNFKDICKEEEFVTKKNNENKYYIDTVFLNKKMLINCGILEENIIDSKFCTACNSNLTHSYRIEKEQSKRSTAVICLK